MITPTTEPGIATALSSPAPLARGVPAVYLEADSRIGDPDASFVHRFTSGLDAVLAPVFCALNSLPAYFDPRTAPEYFLDWLSGWVALDLYERWPAHLRRELIASAVEFHRHRGTRRGLAQVVAIFAEVEPGAVSIEESGGVWGSSRLVPDDGSFPEFPVAPADGAWMKIQVAIGSERYARAAEIESVKGLVSRVVAKVKPAHVVLLDVGVSA